MDRIGLSEPNWTKVNLIGLNRNCFIFRQNKFSSKNFREYIIHYITILCIPKIWFLGSTFTWAYNLFMWWALSFLLGVVLYPVTQMHSCFLRSFSLPHRVTPFLSWFGYPFLLRFPPRPPFAFFPTPLPHSLLLFMG